VVSLTVGRVAWGRVSHRYARPGIAAGLWVLAAYILISLRHQPYWLTIAWAGAMVASFVGWGSLVNLWLAPDRWHDWGLRAGWGMALFLLVGGYLCLLHAAVRPVLVTEVLLGVGALLGILVLRRPRRVSKRRMAVVISNAGLVLLLIGASGLASLHFLGALGNQGFQPSDDPPLYYVFAQKLLQTGSFYEPFAARRITTFGGQVYLHASFLAVAPLSYLNAVDDGIGLVVVVALLVGACGPGGLKARHAAPLALALLLLFSLQNVRVNSTSLLTGVAALLTLYRTVRVPLGTAIVLDRPTWPIETRRVIALAGLAVTCIVLRTSNTAAVVPFVVMVIASDFLLAIRRPWASAAVASLGRAVGIWAGTIVLALLPWSLMMHQSVGTFFFPLGHPNLTPGWTFLEPAKTRAEVLTKLFDLVFYDPPVSLFIPFAVAGLLPLAGRPRNDVVALTLASFVGVLSLARNGAAFGPNDSSRYAFAYCVAMALVTCLSVRGMGARAALVAAGLGMHLTTSREGLHKSLNELIASAAKGYKERLTAAVDFAAQTGDYRDVQSRVPAGAAIATAVHEGWQFDFSRNPLFALDVMGGMGPKPGWPAYKGAQALGDYFIANGIRYLIWVDFNLPSEFYNRGHWQSHLAKEGSYLQGEARLQLDAEDAIEKLTSMRSVVYKAHGMTVVDLAQSPPRGEQRDVPAKP
jgi:hypothetical protein